MRAFLRLRSRTYRRSSRNRTSIRPCPARGATSPVRAAVRAPAPAPAGRNCAEAPRRLSSEPDRFPIEAGIVPLVYAFSSLRLLPPCWSCEGHAGPDGRPHRVPGVWFFSRKLVYPGLVAELLARLKAARRLAHHWQVSTIGCGVDADWGFAVEPRPTADDSPDLERLRGDAAVIAEDLGKGVRGLAATHIARLRKALDRSR